MTATIPTDEPSLLSTFMDELTIGGDPAAAVALARRHPQANQAPAVQKSWARALVIQGDGAQAEGWISSPEFVEESVRADVATWAKLQTLAGRAHPDISKLHSEVMAVYQNARRTGLTTALAERFVALDAALKAMGDASNIVANRVSRFVTTPQTPEQAKATQMLRAAAILPA